MGSKVSIIMPLYNAEKYVSKTIQSFVQQSYKDKELVIVDDCSTDGSYDVAVRYSRLYPAIKVHQLESNSGGPSVPKNAGIALSTGDYLSFLDHDDYDGPEKINDLVKVFDTYPETQVVFSDVYGMDEEGNADEFGTLCNSKYTERAKEYLSKLENNIYQCDANYLGAVVKRMVGMSTQGVMIRRESLLALEQYFDPKYGSCDDIDMWVRLFTRYNVKFYDKPLTYFRRMTNSLSSQSIRLISDASKYHEDNLLFFKNLLTNDEFIIHKKNLSNIFFRLGYVLSRESPSLSRQSYIKSMKYDIKLVTLSSYLKTFV